MSVCLTILPAVFPKKTSSFIELALAPAIIKSIPNSSSIASTLSTTEPLAEISFTSTFWYLLH